MKTRTPARTGAASVSTCLRHQRALACSICEHLLASPSSTCLQEQRAPAYGISEHLRFLFLFVFFFLRCTLQAQNLEITKITYVIKPSQSLPLRTKPEHILKKNLIFFLSEKPLFITLEGIGPFCAVKNFDLKLQFKQSVAETSILTLTFFSNLKVLFADLLWCRII